MSALPYQPGRGRATAPSTNQASRPARKRTSRALGFVQGSSEDLEHADASHQAEAVVCASGYLGAVLDDADRIWNRACDPFAQLSATGDRALQAALLVHGQVMNGGLLSALDSIDYDQIERGADGFEYFGLGRAADILRTALRVAFPDGPIPEDEREEYTLSLPEQMLDQLEGELDAEFDVETQALDDAFARHYRDRPNDFAPA